MSEIRKANIEVNRRLQSHTGDAQCADCHAGRACLEETILVAALHGLKWVETEAQQYRDAYAEGMELRDRT